MLKLMGCVLLLTAPLLLAVSHYCAYRRGEQLLASFADMLALCAGEIRTERMSLPSLAAMLAREGPPPLWDFWSGIETHLMRREDSFETIWGRALRDLGLPGAAVPVLEPFPALLRGYDVEQLAAGLGRMQNRLEEYRAEAQRRFRRDFKARTGVQFSCAALLLILLF